MGPRVEAAVHDNAQWCETVCRLHRLSGRFGARAWTSPRRTPALHPDAVTLDRAATREDVLPHIDVGPGCSIKDSFACLDLVVDGFEVLFDATWVGCASMGGRTTWAPIGPAGFADWALMVDAGDVLTPSLLADDTVVLLECRRAEELRGVAVLTRGPEVTGISNLVTLDDPVSAWRGVAAAAARPAVGYERGPALDAACAAGFAKLGSLRVWQLPTDTRR